MTMKGKTYVPASYTLALIKPDAFRRLIVGSLIARIEADRFEICSVKMPDLDRDLWKRFYGLQHDGRPYFDDLVNFMSGGRVLALVLCRIDAIRHWRRQMGPSDPAKREPGQVRHYFGDPQARQTENLVHGSDSEKSLEHELSVLGWDWRIYR